MAQPEVIKDIEARVKKSGDTMTGLLKTNGSIENQGEAKFIHPTYCPNIEDTAVGIGCAFKASRGHFNQMNVNEFYLPATATTNYESNKILFKSYSGGNNGTYTGVSEIAQINTTGLKVGSSSIGINGYIEGTWLRTTSAGNDKTGDFAIIDDLGWIYKRTPAQVLSDIGAAPKSHSHNSKYVKKSGDTMTGRLYIKVMDNQILLGNDEYKKTILRNDGSDFWLLVSDVGSNEFNSLRPFRFNLSSGQVYISHGLDITGGTFNYSSIQSGSSNANRNVWFSTSGSKGTPCFNDNFKYNPSTNTLTVGSITGNAATATKATQDENGKNIASTYRPLRRNICGQSEGTITNPWYKFASIIITGAYEDRTITFKVSQGYSDNAKMSGILTAHIRTTNPVGFENAQLIWEYANDSIVTSDWVLAYLSTSGTDCKVELWCKQDAAWSQYHFEVLSCHDRTGWRDDWVLYNTQSAGSASGPTSGYTKIESVYGVLRASAVYGAVWNDYAEYRSSDLVEPGRVICETGNGTLKLSTERLQPGANVVSDTFGFAIGETENCKTPIAVSGRALVYTHEDRYSYNAGDPVCAGPGGTVSKMSREEVMMYPDRIVGTVSEIPEYEHWGSGNVEVKNRIWIKIK